MSTTSTQPGDKPAHPRAIAEMVRQHMRSADGQRQLAAETARQLQRLADAIAPLDTRRRYDIPTALSLLAVSRKRFYQHVKAGRIRIIKDGRRSYCSGSEIARLSQAPVASESA